MTLVRAKLKVGAVDDPLEREADAVARQVLDRLRSGATSRAPMTSTEDPGRARRSATAEVGSAPSGPNASGPGLDGPGPDGHGREGGEASADVARRVQRSSGGGRSLDTDVRRRMERGFGADFAGVRVHADADAAQLNRSLNARAFTKGSDIYFGAGEYRPETSSGQELLAHELTHTLQQGSERVRRSAVPASQVSDDRADRIRRWDMKNGVDIGKAVRIRTITSGQSVFMLKDAGGDEIVVKSEDMSLSLLKLATLVHESVHDVETVDSYPIDAAQTVTLISKIGDPSVTSDPSWAAVGKRWKRPPSTDDDQTAGRKHHQTQVRNKTLTAQKLAKGDSAKNWAETPGDHAKLRSVFSSPKWMKQIGAAAAADMFTGNADRAGGYAANLGNFITTADERVQLIDNMDKQGQASFSKANDEPFSMDMLDWGRDPVAYYKAAIDTLLAAAERDGATGITAWADSDGGFTRRFMIDDYRAGFEETIAKIVRLYGKDKGGKAGRAAKADIKALGSHAGNYDYWEILKARARFLQNPKKEKELRLQVRTRQRDIDKKASKKKK